MKDKPIIFSAPMIRALLDGRKSQTRRLTNQPRFDPAGVCNANMGGRNDWWDFWQHGTLATDRFKAPYAIGDRLWVREAWAPLDHLTHNDPGTQALADRGFYRADGGTNEGEISRWRPSIHMPRWASRITLTVTDVRVQQLWRISADDVHSEGVEWGVRGGAGDYRHQFMTLWNSIHGPDAWDANPWVVAVSFDVRKGNIDAP